MDEENNSWGKFILSTIAGMPYESLHSNVRLFTSQYGGQVLPFVVTGKIGYSIVIIPEDYPENSRKALKESNIIFIVTKNGMTSQELIKLVEEKQKDPFWLSFCKWLLAQ
jgi:hypothetical protein